MRTVSLTRFEIPLDEFQAAPGDGRGLFIVAQTFLTQTRIFRDCIYFSTHGDLCPDDLRELAQDQQALLFARVLLGFAWEARSVLLQVFEPQGKLRHLFDSFHLRPDEETSLARAFEYFEAADYPPRRPGQMGLSSHLPPSPVGDLENLRK